MYMCVGSWGGGCTRGAGGAGREMRCGREGWRAEGARLCDQTAGALQGRLRQGAQFLAEVTEFKHAAPRL